MENRKYRVCECGEVCLVCVCGLYSSCISSFLYRIYLFVFFVVFILLFSTLYVEARWDVLYRIRFSRYIITTILLRYFVLCPSNVTECGR